MPLMITFGTPGSSYFSQNEVSRSVIRFLEVEAGSQIFYTFALALKKVESNMVSVLLMSKVYRLVR